MAEPVNLSIDQKVLVTLSVTDRVGAPASFDELPVWESSNADFLTVEPAEDGMSAWLVSSDETTDESNAVLVTVRGDADLGDGVREIIGTLQVNLTAGEAQFVALVAGQPESKDAPEPTPAA